ncbi:MAG: SDR family NAD(P)-dependent oxidoreductase, partial [Candidatus Aminicenantales bacterium]
MIFNQKVSIVTGASQGIGEAIARELGQEGATIILVDIQKEKLEEVAGRFQAEGLKARPLVADVTDLTQVEGVVESVMKEYGRLDHLINNAGITRDTLLLRMKEEDWDLVLAVNL